MSPHPLRELNLIGGLATDPPLVTTTSTQLHLLDLLGIDLANTG